MRYKLVIWKLLPCFPNPGDFSQPNQTSSATNTFGKHSNLFLQNGLQSFFFFYKIYSQSFLTFYYYRCLEVSPESIYCLVLFRNKLSMNQDLEISTSLLLCEMSNFVPFAHSSCIQIILSKTCQMLDKRRLRNLGESIIKRVLVVVACQSSPGTPSKFLLD